MTNTFKHAKLELDVLVNYYREQNTTAIVEEFIPEILALVEKFGQSGQSGSSAPLTAAVLCNTIEKLCLQEPISPITGIEEEWHDITDRNENEPMWQNKRCSALFKDKDGNVKYIDAIVKRTPNGSCWNGSFWASKKDFLSGNSDLKIHGSQLIRGFPFEPKTFYIDVIEEEVAPDDWEMYAKDTKQLAEVFEYYKPKPIVRKVLIEK